VATCVGLAAIALVAFSAFGTWRTGAAVAIGLVLGSFNGLLAKHGVDVALEGGIGFRASSLVRMGILTAVGLGLGVMLGLPQVAFVIGGIALAQLVLVGVSAWEVSRV
jgi:hypothetical protein